MKKILIILTLILFLPFTIGGCKIETGTSFGLKIEDAVIARQNKEGKLIPVPDGVFKKGETIHIILLNVGKFEKGEDGKHRLDMDLEVKAPDGVVIYSKQNMLGEKGHIILENDIAPSPSAYFSTALEQGLLKDGTYKIKLTIHDKISGGRASKTKTFILK